jgi:hypothetical protein
MFTEGKIKSFGLAKLNLSHYLNKNQNSSKFTVD